MALIKCPECGKEISDKSGNCPGCGYPIQSIESDGYIAAVKGKRNRKIWIIIGVLIGVVILTGIIAGVSISSKNAKIREQQKAERNEIITYNRFVDNLNALYAKSYDGASNAEPVCVLTANVWMNSIYKKSDKETDKYTAGTSDFNEAIQKIYKDEEITKKLVKAQETQEKCNNIIQEIQSIPDELDKCYDAAVQLNTTYISLVELAISPSGNLNSYKESLDSKTEAYISAYNTLGALIPPKKEVPLYDNKGKKVKDEFAFSIHINQMPNKLPDTVDSSMAKVGFGNYTDVAKVCGTEGKIHYNEMSGVVSYISWEVENPSDTITEELVVKLREKYGKEQRKEDNTYNWGDEQTNESLMLKTEKNSVIISWFNLN